MSTVPGKDNPADIGTKYEKGDDVQRFSEWINFKDEEASEDAKEKRRSETKTIVGTMGGSILTAASVASAKADTGHHINMHRMETCSERHDGDGIWIRSSHLRDDIRHRRGQWRGTWYLSHAR